MGWKLVRDGNEAWCRAHGVSGQWRASPDPAASLRRKIFEEAGEYAEHCDPGELYDLLDVVQALIDLEDPDLKAHYAHQRKVVKMGGFTRFAEWTPVPAGIRDVDDRSEDDAAYIAEHGSDDLETGHLRDPEGDEAAHA